MQWAAGDKIKEGRTYGGRKGSTEVGKEMIPERRRRMGVGNEEKLGTKKLYEEVVEKKIMRTGRQRHEGYRVEEMGVMEQQK